MTNHTRFSQVSLAALLLAGLSAACTSNPLAGTDQSTLGGGVYDASTSTGGTSSATGGAGGVQPCVPASASYCYGNGGAGAETEFWLVSSPEREVDILFVVDNSLSMDPKQMALAANFPRLVQQLQSLPGGLPDVHIGVISTDMGAGSEDIGGNCSRVLGDRGLLWGNDPTPGAIATVAGAPNNGCGLNPGARWIEDIQNPNGVGRQQNYTGNLTDVLACLAKGVGVNGCGYEHQLQSLRLALNPTKLPDGTDINMANVGFLRPQAYLSIILVTDEDDCSADPSDMSNDSMFLRLTPGQTASMRCAARGHVCNGQPIPNYNAENGGYSGTGFSANFANCTAKDPGMSGSNGLLPLIPVQAMIDSVNAVKARPTEQILVSGIIGWPPDTTLPGVQTSNQYQIAIDTSSAPPDNTYWDYLPICRIPSIVSADGSQYRAYGGLRLKKFIDGFGANGQTFSICNQDFTAALTQTGNALVQTMKTGCVPYPLMDTDPNTPGIQPDCQVFDRIGCDTPGVSPCLLPGYIENLLPECMDAGFPLNPATPQLTSIPDSARPCWYLSYDTTPVTGCPGTPNGQKITALRPTGTVAPMGSELALTCRTCPASNPECVGTKQ